MSISNEHVADLRLFVVDDDDDTRSNLRDILELDGYQVAEASCAKDLFALPGWESVAVILLDRRLPDGRPEQLLPQIKARAPHASVIVITGFADIEAAVSALRLGASDYILKPVNPDALLASVRREIEHQRSERQLNALFENALDGLVIFDSAENVIDANPTACSIFSVLRKDVLGRDLRSVAGLESAIQESVFPRSQPQGELKLRRKDGTVIDVEYQVTFNFHPGRNLASIRDVSERKRSEQRALQAERLAAIGETVTALAHESRNALQRSVTCLDILATEVEDRPIAMDLVRRAKKSQQLLQQLYEEVRHWAAPIKLECRYADLSQVWREAWQQVKQVHGNKNVQLKESVSGDPHCAMDAGKIGQVFRNIFENAVEVSPDPGVIELWCGVSSANEVSIKILDQGPGMSAEQLARAFEPFFTTKTRGTGLGLSISNRIIQAHQGKIVASSPGGACFEITLPRGAS